jgi:hypothetical protein
VNITIPEKKILVREPVPDDNEYRYFGIVGNRYNVIQNDEIGRILDPISKVWHLETLGALGLGQTVFITFDMGDRMIAGELHHCYLLVNENKDGISALKMAIIFIRVECLNTLNAALKSAIIRADIPHMGQVGSELEFRTNLLVQAEKARQSYIDTFEALAKVALANNQAQFIFEHAYPLPKRSGRTIFAEEIKSLGDESLTSLLDAVVENDVQYRSDVKKQESLRLDAMELYKNLNRTAPTIAGSPLAAYNAVVELEDWRTGNETMFASSLWGSRAKTKQRAFDAALAFLR